MEQNKIPEIARKLWNIVRVAFFMVTKGILKRKILMDLNLMMKRGKIAGKALNNLLFHHHHHTTAFYSGDYEFSCSNTPLYKHYFTGKHHQQRPHYKAAAPLDFEGVLDMMDMSPVLPGLGFGQSPLVRQLRITDSPFPVQSSDEDNSIVDDAAEEFIQKFYRMLKQQK